MVKIIKLLLNSSKNLAEFERKGEKSNLMDMSLGLSIAKVNALPVELYLLPLKSRSCLLLIEHAGG